MDFLLKKGSRFHAIEVKSGSRLRPEDLSGLRSIADLPKLGKRIVLYPSIDAQRTEDGIEIMGYRDFFAKLAAGRALGE